MPTINLKSMSDIRLMRELLVQVSKVDKSELTQDTDVRAVLGIEMVRRLNSVGYENNELNEDCLFFEKGMTQTDVSDLILANLGLYSESLKTLIGYIDLSSIDLETFEFSLIDARDSLVIGYNEEFEAWYDLISGIVPLDPYSDKVLHSGDVLVMSEIGKIIHLKRLDAMKDVLAKVITPEQAQELLDV
jgi:hypothetical protein